MSKLSLYRNPGMIFFYGVINKEGRKTEYLIMEQDYLKKWPGILPNLFSTSDPGHELFSGIKPGLRRARNNK
jgi:hypothetical protein